MKRQEHSPAYVLKIKANGGLSFLFAGSLPPEYTRQSFLPEQALKLGFAVVREGARLMRTEALEF
jgi:hypothetical protein